MPSGRFVEATAGGCVIAIDVSPEAGSTEIVGINEWRGTLHIRVGAAPVKGKANEELRRVLSEALGLEKSKIKIIKGARSNRKKVFVELPPEDVEQRLGRCV